MRAPFVPSGSLTTWTTTSWPSFSRSSIFAAGIWRSLPLGPVAVAAAFGRRRAARSGPPAAAPRLARLGGLVGLIAVAAVQVGLVAVPGNGLRQPGSDAGLVVVFLEGTPRSG